MMETLEVLRDRCDKEIQVRVLPTQYDTRTKLGREVLSELRSKFRDYLMECTINFNTKLKEAASLGQPITEYDPGSRGYKDFVNLAHELMGHRAVEMQPAIPEKLSRPAELVQRARQLAQLTNLQFGRTSIPTPELATISEATKIEAPQRVIDLQAEIIAVADVAEDDPEEMTEEREAEIEQKILDFYGVKQVGHQVLFAGKFEQASKVAIAGDFNGWSHESLRMEPAGRAGEFMAKLELNPGRYRYRLVVDGKWMTDPNNQYVESNQFGELNNVVEVDP